MSTAFIQLQCMEAPMTVEAQAPIRFDTVLNQSDHISYDADTGNIQLHMIGIYHIDWSVMLEETSVPVSLSLKTSDGRILSSESPPGRNRASGSAILHVDTPELQITLHNGEQPLRLQTVSPAANLVMYAGQDNRMETDGPSPLSEAVIYFQNGMIDREKPLTWPILLNLLTLSDRQEQITNLYNALTTDGLLNLIGIDAADPGFSAIINPIIPVLQGTAAPVEASLKAVIDAVSSAGIRSTDTLIGHAHMELIPADIQKPSLTLGYSPCPHLIPRDGIITSFAAEFDPLVFMDASVIQSLPAVIDTYNNMIRDIPNALNVIDLILPSVLFQDKFRELMPLPLNTGIPVTNYHIHAVLWHGIPFADPDSGGNITWRSVTDLDLGPVPFEELLPLTSFLTDINEAPSAGDKAEIRLAQALYGLSASPPSPVHTPLNAAHRSGLLHPVQAGDYTTVRFTLAGNDQTTLLTGVIAANAMAGITLQ